MTVQEQEHIRQKGYALAMRYIANAKDSLKKAGRNGIYFKDSKYVSSASGIAYKGVLVALDTWLELKGIELPKTKPSRKERGKTIDFYRENLAKLDKKLLQDLNMVYDILHLLGYYDGFLSVKVINEGFEIAGMIINRIKPKVAL